MWAFLFMSLTTLHANQSRLLLFELRGGDFAHPGDRDAINLILDDLKELKSNTSSQKVLDVGCGFGGTLDYLKQQGFDNLHGIDHDVHAIEHALKKYSKIAFHKGDANYLPAPLKNQFFDIITLVSVLYSIEKPSALFDELNNITQKGALLVLFDYTTTSHTTFSQFDFAGKKMHPLNLTTIKQELDQKGWNIVKQRDLSQQFINWYDVFLKTLLSKKEALLEKFSPQTFNQVYQTFLYLLEKMRQQDMGGAVLYAQKR